MNDPLVNDMTTFGHHLMLSEDVDPIYPVLRSLNSHANLSMDEGLWLTALYLAYYNLPSALAVFNVAPEPEALWKLLGTRAPATFRDHYAKLPISVERRGHRDYPKLVDHLASLVENIREAGSLKQWLWAGLVPSGEFEGQNYELLWDRAQLVHGNGRWAAFKWLELLKEVHHFPIAAPDMRLKYCSGPKAGLCLVTGLREDARLERLEQAAMDLRGLLAEPKRGLPLSWERLETLCCNFHSLHAGRYYVGHDIDEMQEQLNHPMVQSEWTVEMFKARRAALPPEYLGELGGWTGVRRDLLTLYRDHGSIYRAGENGGRLL